MKYSQDIIKLKGIGEKTAKLFNRLGIYTTEDLLRHYPRSYQAFKPPVKIAEGIGEDVATVELFLPAAFKWKKVRNLTIGTGVGSDGTDNVSLTFFNMPYLKNKLTAGSSYLFRGKLKAGQGQYHMDQPKLFTWKEYEERMGCLQPCYSLTAGLTDRTVARAVEQALNSFEEEEYLPEEIREEYALTGIAQAVWQIHFPKDYDSLLAARKRLVFDEFFLFLLAVRKMKEYNEELATDYPMMETAWTGRLLEMLPYKLTGAQKRVWEELKADLVNGRCMNRLVQGDVGSGKTILAFLCLLLTVSNGCQGALMAPTELLASQHFEQLCSMTEKYGLPFKPALLTGSVGAAAKRKIYKQIEEGEVNVIIGTHALIQEKVVYQKLALVITDEQHRFGVRQREILSEKGGKAHVLVMSATPIPRTLAIILYGDMHLSVVDELPANRVPVKNCVVGTSYREKAYEFITKQVRMGKQVYVICPMVGAGEEGEDGLENVVDYGEKLKNRLPADICVEILHGKMRPGDKKRVMEAFGAGYVHVLVSTTVIEVGINVPNATVMMIENAERFGLAQLHQLRGRIGRGKDQSYCIFISGTDKEESMERLKILSRSNDGFYIAREDLKLRGPGDLFGIRQSGAMEFRIADIYQDAELIPKISMTVEHLLTQGRLETEKYGPLRRYLNENAGNYIDFRSI
ncbi:ATP-dependent DNA helicase RecG [Parablautia intestinalis]|uniref:ATP-dependent DNA helicase RecG n=1 Tax=Parablautia intestinalis TaxID=2320100 RepID=UPI00256F5E50|nr:ATP-dependent DNA helicase RecG [Parablautia intestinalis]